MGILRSILRRIASFFGLARASANGALDHNNDGAVDFGDVRHAGKLVASRGSALPLRRNSAWLT